MHRKTQFAGFPGTLFCLLAALLLVGATRAQEAVPTEGVASVDAAVEEVAVEADDPGAREVLQKAMERSRSASYRCDVEDASLMRLAEAKEGTFWRLVLKDGFVCRKLELRDAQGQTVLVFTQNRDGSFAYAKGEWAKVMEILPLHYFDHISSDLDAYEKSIAVFSQQTRSYGGREQIHVRMDTLEDTKKLRGGSLQLLLGGRKEQVTDLGSRYYARRPMHRIFTIDTTTGVVVSRFHFNYRKQKVYGRTMRHLVLNPEISEKDFAPSGKVQRECLLLNEQFLYQHFGDPKHRTVRNLNDRAYHRPSALEGWFRRMYAAHGNLVLYVPLGALGILFLAVALFLRYRRDDAGVESGA